jgi:Domain of unknown function (DUF1906)
MFMKDLTQSPQRQKALRSQSREKQISISAAVRVAALFVAAIFIANTPSTPQESASHFYLGFDRNIYPGDEALPILRKTFAFTGYWLSPPPGEKTNTWLGKRELLRSQGFGFLVLFRGRASRELKNEAAAKGKATLDTHHASTAAAREGFPPNTIIFLDIEEGGRLPAVYHIYLHSWVQGIARAGFLPGVYCSGIAVKEDHDTMITTADDIRDHNTGKAIAFWLYNDACPPSPGCAFSQNPPSPARSGILYADVWQFAQSPRRKEFTVHCPAKYSADGNCYAPGDTTHSWFLDVNSATSRDPSGGAK